MIGTRGFFAGAVGGLALAVLLVGAATLLPQASVASRQPASGSVTMTTISTISPKGLQVGTTPYASQSSAVPSIESQAAPNGAAAASSPPSSTSNKSSASVTTITITAKTTQALQRPASLLGALQRESVTNLIGVMSPLLLGLLVGALVYGAYARRLDSST